MGILLLLSLYFPCRAALPARTEHSTIPTHKPIPSPVVMGGILPVRSGEQGISPGHGHFSASRVALSLMYRKYITLSAPCPAKKWPMAMGIRIALTGPS
jgi:hypothetical protein